MLEYTLECFRTVDGHFSLLDIAIMRIACWKLKLQKYVKVEHGERKAMKPFEFRSSSRTSLTKIFGGNYIESQARGDHGFPVS